MDTHVCTGMGSNKPRIRQPSAQQFPVVMTILDLAAYLQISKSSLYQIVRRGSVPCQRVGRHLRFHKEAIDLWIKTGKAGKPSGCRKRT